MSRFETPDMALRRAQILAQRETQRQRGWAQKVRQASQQMRQRRQPAVGAQNQISRDYAQRLSPDNQRRFWETLTPAQQLQEAQNRPLTAPADIGSPAGEAVFPGVVGKIPGLRTPAEAASTLGTAGMGSLPMAAKSGALALGLGGAFGGGEVAEQLGAPRPVGEVAGGLAGGLAGGIGGPMAARRIGAGWDEAVESAGGVRQLAAQETGGTRIPQFLKPRPPKPSADPEVDKLITAFKGARPLRGETELLRSEELSRRAGTVGGIIRGEGSAEARFRAGRAAQSGELPAAEFESIRPQFTQDEIDNILDRALLHPFGPRGQDVFKNQNAAAAILNALDGAKLPTRYEINLIEDIYGPKLAGVMLSKRSLGTKAWENFVDAANIPRTVLTILDHSIPGRQNWKLAPTYPGQWADSALTGFRAIFRPAVARQVDEALLTDARPIQIVTAAGDRRDMAFAELKRIGNLFHAPFGETAEMSAREEAFLSRWARRLPGIGQLIKASERGALTSANKIRADVLYKVAKGAEESGKPLNLAELEGYSALFNEATGRGTLGALNQYAPVLSGLQFSPRFRASGPEWVAQILNPNRRVRQEAAKQVLAFFGSGATILAVIKESGLADVEVDPRSTDFGKIRIGDQRIDFWAGMQPIARALAQITSGQRKTQGGNIVPTERFIGFDYGAPEGVAWNYFRSGMAPLAAGLTDIATGETIIGQKVPRSPEIEAKERLVPLAWQDIIDGIRLEGLRGGLISGLGLGGFGVQSYTAYEPPPPKAKKPAKGKKREQINPAVPKIQPRRRPLEGTIGGR